MSSPRIKFSLSLVAVIALMAIVLGVVAGRASGGVERSSGGGDGGAAAGKKIDVIIKASDSSFWQSMLAGAKKAGDDFGVEVGLFGPTSETDVNQQVQLVENSISRGADAIVDRAELLRRAQQRDRSRPQGRHQGDHRRHRGDDRLRGLHRHRQRQGRRAGRQARCATSSRRAGPRAATC